MLFIFFLGSCGGEFTDANGHMSSPSYPKIYPAYADCIYNISQPTGTVILLNCLYMDMQIEQLGCTGDYLDIRDGTSGASPLLAKLCGNENPTPIMSSQNELLLR